MDIITLALAKNHTKAEIAKLGTIQVLRGRLATYEELLAIPNPMPGDVYIIGTAEEENNEYIYAGDEWEKLGPIFDSGDVASKVYVNEQIEKLSRVLGGSYIIAAPKLSADLINEAIATYGKSIDWEKLVLIYGNDKVVSTYKSTSQSSTETRYTYSRFPAEVNLSSDSSVSKISTQVRDYVITVDNASGQVIRVSTSTSAPANELKVLRTDYNYSTPYTPLYSGSPVTKKYVDDKEAAILTAIEPMSINLTGEELESSLANDDLNVGQAVICTDKKNTYQEGHTYVVKEKMRGAVPVAQQLRDLGFTVSTSFENTLNSNGIKYFYIVEYGDEGKMYTAYSKVPLDVSDSEFPASGWKTFSVSKKNSSDPNLYYYQSNTYKNLTSMTQLTSSINSGLYWATNFSPAVVATYSNDPDAAAYTKYVINENELIKYVDDVFPVTGQMNEVCDLITGFNNGTIPAGAYFAAADTDNFSRPSTSSNYPVYGVFSVYDRLDSSSQTAAYFLYSKYNNLNHSADIYVNLFGSTNGKLPTSSTRLKLTPVPSGAVPSESNIASALRLSGDNLDKLVTAGYLAKIVGTPTSSSDASNILASHLKTTNKAIVAAINELYDTIETISEGAGTTVEEKIDEKLVDYYTAQEIDNLIYSAVGEVEHKLDEIIEGE